MNPSVSDLVHRTNTPIVLTPLNFFVKLGRGLYDVRGVTYAGIEQTEERGWFSSDKWEITLKWRDGSEGTITYYTLEKAERELEAARTSIEKYGPLL